MSLGADSWKAVGMDSSRIRNQNSTDPWEGEWERLWVVHERLVDRGQLVCGQAETWGKLTWKLRGRGDMCSQTSCYGWRHCCARRCPTEGIHMTGLLVPGWGRGLAGTCHLASPLTTGLLLESLHNMKPGMESAWAQQRSLHSPRLSCGCMADCPACWKQLVLWKEK